ncbi:MAG TPA: glycosyltransferase family 2 protein [Candidatus Poseidoniales archaeon]|nr:MAG TPA: glycosyltransferase family 2 protein [Candidatus Poseidoniales archaeon]
MVQNILFIPIHRVAISYLHQPRHDGIIMRNGWHVGVVIPAKNEEDFISQVIISLPNFVDSVVVVDDGSVDNTAMIVQELANKMTTLETIRLPGNGVGSAIDAGHQKMLQLLPEPFVSVVMAGDGQMDPKDLINLLEPITKNEADYAKGNRFLHQDGPDGMPYVRQLASMILGFFTTLAAGRQITDPQCGYTATSYRVLNQWDWSKSWKTYGYPNYWLIELSRLSLRVVEVPVKSIYGDEKSGIIMPKFFLGVGLMMLIMHHKRCFSMLLTKSVAPHTILAFIAYILGWIAILPGISTDLEDEVTSGFISKIVLLIICWSSAHILDRLAVGSRTELRVNAQT